MSSRSSVAKRFVAKRILIFVGTALVCLALALATQSVLLGRQHARCVKEAQTAVEAYLRDHPNATLGEFQGMNGEGYGGPTPWSPAGFYLQAYRTARFTKGTWKLRILVCMPGYNGPDTLRVTPPKGQDSDFYVVHPGLHAGLVK
jgi:hypothetical protein